jgi:hypothetical protein
VTCHDNYTLIYTLKVNALNLNVLDIKLLVFPLLYCI